MNASMSGRTSSKGTGFWARVNYSDGVTEEVEIESDGSIYLQRGGAVDDAYMFEAYSGRRGTTVQIKMHLQGRQYVPSHVLALIGFNARPARVAAASIGSITTKVTIGGNEGATCTKCKRHNEYAAPSRAYVCYECRV